MAGVFERIKLNKLRYLVVTITGLILLTVLLIVLITNSRHNITIGKGLDYTTTRSQVSLTTSSLSTTSEKKGYLFENEVINTALNEKLSSQSVCRYEDTIQIRTNISRYWDNTNSSLAGLNLESYYVSAGIFRDVPEYTQESEYILDGYNKITSLLSHPSNEILSLPKTFDLQKLFLLGCAGDLAIPSIYLEKIDYKETDAAALVISYGSTQSVISPIYIPTYIQIYSHINNDYGVITLSIDKPSLLFDSNNLAQCELVSEYGNKYLPMNDCTSKELLRVLNYDKLEIYKQALLEAFALKST